jgi:hypothetical protein
MKACTSDRISQARRIREIRAEAFGEGRSGLEAMAAELSLSARAWEDYEAGVTMPGRVLLQFVVTTGADPIWLATGSGERYLIPPQTPRGLDAPGGIARSSPAESGEIGPRRDTSPVPG